MATILKRLIQWFKFHNSLVYSFHRYAYSGDGSEDFDKDDTLTLIKPSPLPSKEVRTPSEVKPTLGGSGNGDVEEDKTE